MDTQYKYDSKTMRSLNRLFRTFKKENPKPKYDKEAIHLTIKIITRYIVCFIIAYLSQKWLINNQEYLFEIYRSSFSLGFENNDLDFFRLLLMGILYFIIEYIHIFSYAAFVLPGVMLPPVFMIQHDCGHGSFHSSKKVRDSIGLICSLLTWIPYVAWAVEHSLHHLYNAIHNFKNFGDILTFTLEEIVTKSFWKRSYYRFFRSIFGFLGLGGFLYPIVFQRFSPVNSRDYSNIDTEIAKDIRQKMIHAKKSYRDTNIVLIIFYGILTFLLDWRLLIGIIISVWIFGTIAMFFFYVQHQHEEAFKYHLIERESTDELLYHKAALKGSVVFDLPKWLVRHMLYITEHPPHHLHENMSLMELRDFMKYIRDLARSGNSLAQWFLEQSPKVTFMESLSLLRCYVYDNDNKTFRTPSEAKKIRKLYLRTI